MSFEVRAGELFGFVGSNGAGKTTAMRIVLGVLAADAGEVRWDGAPVTLESRRRGRRAAGVSGPAARDDPGRAPCGAGLD